MDVHGTRPPREQAPSFSGLFSRPLFLFVILAALGWMLLGPRLETALFDPLAEARAITPRGNLADDELSTIEIFEQGAPSVVFIATHKLRKERHIFGSRTYEIPEGTGTGFVWDELGHIVTNYHVIQNADSARVRMHDGTEYDAITIGIAPSRDLAVLWIDAPAYRLRALPLGTSEDLKVGQKVFAIGNPFGLDQTLTTGVISGLERAIYSVSQLVIHGVIQTDAAINPGNSGGPLLDSAGRLIGVNTSIKSPTGASAGIGFAVPVDLVNQVVPRILRKGFDSTAGLGITLGPDAWARDLGLRGAVVKTVLRGSGAEDAGLRPVGEGIDGHVILGDVIIGLDAHEIGGQEDLFRVLTNYEEGDTVGVRLQGVSSGRVQERRLNVVLRRLLPADWPRPRE